MDFRKLRAEVLQALRGKTSQMALSGALGYSHNQVYRWESGQIRTSWLDFVHICNHLDVPLETVLVDFIGYPLRVESSRQVVKALIGLNRIDDVAKAIDRSKHIIYRWLRGESEPQLEDIFLLTYKSTNWLFEFISSLTDERKVPLLKDLMPLRRKEKEFHYDNPLFGAVIRALELTDYERAANHSDALIAKSVGSSVAEIKRLLQSAERKGLIEKIGRKYRAVNKSLSTKGDLDGRRRILNYWLKNLATKSQDPSWNQQQASYLLFTTNTKTHDKIVELNQSHRQALLALLHSDDNRANAGDLDRVVFWYQDLVNLSL